MTWKHLCSLLNGFINMILVIAKCTIPEECNNFLEKYLYIVCVYYQYRVSVCLSACMCMVLSVYYFSLFFCPIINTILQQTNSFLKMYQKSSLSSGAISSDPK